MEYKTLRERARGRTHFPFCYRVREAGDFEIAHEVWEILLDSLELGGADNVLKGVGATITAFEVASDDEPPVLVDIYFYGRVGEGFYLRPSAAGPLKIESLGADWIVFEPIQLANDLEATVRLKLEDPSEDDP